MQYIWLCVLLLCAIQAKVYLLERLITRECRKDGINEYFEKSLVTKISTKNFPIIQNVNQVK